MSEIHFQQLHMLYLFWILPVLLAVALYRFHKKDKALERFAEGPLLNQISTSVSRARQWLKVVLVLAAVLFIVLALTRPAWNRKTKKVEQSGRDIVFVLDVSRSMLAEDLKPNRLEQAKLAIMDLVERLAGDRIALVAFAGSAVLKCPPTLDYGFFRTMLDDIGPDSVTRGGTLIGDALRVTLDEVCSDRLGRFKDIILITDGEDHASLPVEAAKEVGGRGVRLLAVGLGDEKEGQRIPVVNEDGERSFLKHGGEEVWTCLDADTLRRMVDMTPGGRYINVATGTFDLGSIYEKLIAEAEKTQLESRTLSLYEEKYQIFLAIALVLLISEMVISERKCQKTCARVLGVVVVLFCLIFPTPGITASARDLVAQGNEAYSAEDYDRALELYEDAEAEAGEPSIVSFNKGSAYLGKGDFESARSAYETAALQARDPSFEARAQYNLGSTAFVKAEQHSEADPQEALGLYELSTRHFKEAVRLDPQLTQAAENIEVARIRIRDLRDRIHRQERDDEGQNSNPNTDQEQAKSDESGEPRPRQENGKHKGGEERPDAQEQSAMQQQSREKHQSQQMHQEHSSDRGDLEKSRMSRVESEEAKEILLEERENRAGRRRAVRGRYDPVDKDW